jgi:tRNA A-37 threonylcarbamoyl transferase component Bud32
MPTNPPTKSADTKTAQNTSSTSTTAGLTSGNTATVSLSAVYRQEVIIGGWRGKVIYVLWLLLMALALVGAIWAYWCVAQYLYGGTASVYGKWDAQGNIILYPISDSTRALIAEGDVLVALNGAAWPHRSAFSRTEEQVLLFGPLDSSITLTVRTANQPPRTVPLVLDRIHEPTLRWLDGLGVPLEPIRRVWLVMELLYVFGTSTVAVILLWQRRQVLIVQITLLAIVSLGTRLMVEDVRFVPQFTNQLQIIQIGSQLALLLMGLLLPNGRLYQPRWGMLLLLFYSALHISRYMGVLPIPRGLFLFLDASCLLSMLALGVERYRKYLNPVERQQIKWVLVGILIAIVTTNVSIIMVQVLGLQDNGGALIGGMLARVGALIGFWALFIATQRYRLYEADYALNRSLVYGGVTLLLGLVSALFMFIANQASRNTVLHTPLLIGVALGVGAVFMPTRNRLQNLIDRRFFRLRLDLNEIAAQRNKNKAQQGQLTDKTMGVYKLRELIGAGGMGEVYQAEYGGRLVAFKALLPNMQNNPEAIARFERESEIMQQINHPNVVHLIDHGVQGDVRFLVIEYVVGQELGDYLKLRGPLPVDQALLILRDVAAALDHLHRLGIIHRDIKPSNVFIQDTRAVLGDLGIARHIQETRPITQAGLLGTLEYTAPEQIRDATTIDHRADVYALGVMMYQMLAGELPFKGGVGQVVFAHLQQPPPNICDTLPALPTGVGVALMRAMSKDPQDRFDSAGALVRAVQSANSGKASTNTTNSDQAISAY